MNHISTIADYPNMTLDEIITADIQLSGDALLEFMRIAIEEVQDEKADQAIADFAEYLDELSISINEKKEQL